MGLVCKSKLGALPGCFTRRLEWQCGGESNLVSKLIQTLLNLNVMTTQAQT